MKGRRIEQEDEFLGNRNSVEEDRRDEAVTAVPMSIDGSYGAISSPSRK